MRARLGMLALLAGGVVALAQPAAWAGMPQADFFTCEGGGQPTSASAQLPTPTWFRAFP